MFKEEKEDIPGYLTAESHWGKESKRDKTEHCKVTSHCKIPHRPNQKHSSHCGPKPSIREQSSDLDPRENTFSPLCGWKERKALHSSLRLEYFA